jgi:hypothetical protein
LRLLGIRLPYRAWYATICSVLVLAVSVSGCSIKARDSVSATSVEADIATQLVANYHVARPEVHCPVAIPTEVGTKFTCTVSLDGQVLNVEGRVTGARGQVEVHPASALVVTSAAEADMTTTLEKAVGQPVRVSCPVPALLVAHPGHVFVCTAEVGSIARRLIVTVTDLAGALRYRVPPYEPGS